MAESGLLLSPKDDGDAVELSNKVYRKRILPKATINYRGRKITFDDQYLNDLATSYRDGAYDQVAFMLADAQNTHTLDPERFRGEIRGVEVGEDGLYATIAVTEQAANVLKENPKLGVSARILENYERSDGKHFPRALQHVLGTLDPVIPGLGSWEEVALSNGVALENVIDLSQTSYEALETSESDKEGVAVASREELLKQVADATDMTAEQVAGLDMTDEELAIFASAFAPVEETAEEPVDEQDELIEEPGEEAEVEAVAETDEPSDEDIEAAVEALSEEELEALAAELGVTEEASEEVTEEETEPVAEEETPAEPTDSDLAERLGNGEFGSGLEEPVPADDPKLDEMSDEQLAEMTALWAVAQERDAEGQRLQEEEAAAAAAQTEETAATAAEETPAAAEETPAEEPVLAGAGAVTLSNEAPAEVVALSNQVSVLQQQLAEQEFRNLKAEYVRKGVPAALVDLARPVLVAGRALEFSNSSGQQVDPASIVKQLLDSATGYIDLARERGHSYSPEGDDKARMEAEEDKRLAAMWGEQFDH